MKKTLDELILRGGAFAATVLCVICALRILRADAAASGGDPGDLLPIVTEVTEAAEPSVPAVTTAARTADPPTVYVPLDPTTAPVTRPAGTVPAAEPTTGPAASSTAPSAPASAAPEPTEAALPDPPDPAARAALFADIPVTNDAGVYFDPDALAASVPVFAVTDEPLVLIVHTHGSEAYADSTGVHIPGRSQDITQNVVRVGDALCRALNDAGIPALHDETMYDVPSYTASYNEAARGISDTLEKEPSIQIVLDLHRDAYEYPDGSLLSTARDFSGGRAARIMFLVGTDAGTLSHPTWRQHLAFAMALQTRLDALEPGLAKPINIRRQRFNEHLSPGSLLVEIGASGDTLEEAVRAAGYLAQALAAELRQEALP